MTADSDLVTALRPVLVELDQLRVLSYVGGSVASSFHGAARSTLDVDLVADLDEPTALRLIEALRSQYYVSESAVRDAVRRRSCFNLIHLETSFKIDIFVSRNRAFDRGSMARAIVEPLRPGDSVEVRYASVEDTILAKLEWFRLGGEVSERQWSDVIQVAKLHRATLNQALMEESGRQLHVADLVERLWSEIERLES